MLLENCSIILGFKVEELEVYNTLPDPDFPQHLREYQKALVRHDTLVLLRLYTSRWLFVLTLKICSKLH